MQQTKTAAMIDMNGLTWFKDSPCCGEPKCKCSLCLDVITEEEAPAIRFFDLDNNSEIRLHERCFRKRMVTDNANNKRS